MSLARQGVAFIAAFLALGALATVCARRRGLGYALGGGIALILILFLLGAILSGHFLRSTQQESHDDGCGISSVC